MPVFAWSSDPVQTIISFEARHANPDAGALLLFSIWTVESLYYLQDLDGDDDLSQPTVRGHRPDVVDVAHARWATGACITALDLCVSGLARSLCGYSKERELSLIDMYRTQFSNLRNLFPSAVQQWLDSIRADQRYDQIKIVRNALTHGRVIRHFTLPRRRLDIEVNDTRLDIPTVVRQAKDVATDHVLALLRILPTL